MMHQIIPPPIKKGETIGIVATARWMDESILQSAVEIVQGWGFCVKLGKHLQTKNGQLAGTDEQRADDLQKMLDDPLVKVILIARGGYGTVRLVDRVQFDGLRQAPKWICGFSDITVLHARLSRMGIASLHSIMPVSFADNTPEAIESFRVALCGAPAKIDFLPDWMFNEHLLEQPVEGVLIGGNLSVLASLLGSADALPVRNSILLLEDIDEQLYHIDRLLMALRRSGMMHGVKAVLIGGMTAMRDNTREFGFATDNPWGKDIRQMASEILSELGIPILSGVPVGHIADNRTVRLGALCSLQKNGSQIRLQF